LPAIRDELVRLQDEVDKLDADVAAETAREEEAAAGAELDTDFSGKEETMKEAQRAMKKAEGMFNSIKKMIEETTDEEVIAELMGDHDRLWSELEDARAAFNTADLAFKTVAK